MKGRKRHLLVDTLGLPMLLVVHSAGIQDRDGAKRVLKKLGARFPRLQKIWADGGYAGQLVDWTREKCGLAMEIVNKKSAHEFVVLPRRWVVERSFAWLGKYRRLSKDYEEQMMTSEGMTHAAFVNLLLRRLTLSNA